MCEGEIVFLYIQFSSWISPVQQGFKTCIWRLEPSALLFFKFQSLLWLFFFPLCLCRVI